MLDICNSGQSGSHRLQIVEEKTFDSGVVVAPSHRAFLRASLYDRRGYRTPLGIVPVDTELSKKMMNGEKKFNFFPKLIPRSIL